jgi:MFS transporter, ACS family, tartrate transporter
MSTESPLAARPSDPWGERLMRLVWRKPPATLAEQTRRRVAVHVIPVLFALYILAYLDRSNISVAMLRMQHPIDKEGLGLSKEVLGVGMGAFFWGYWILEIPSTLSVLRWGARYVFCRILILWGICATLMGFIGMPWMNDLFAWLPRLPEDIYGLSSIAHYSNGLSMNVENQLYFFRFWLGFFEGGFFPSVIVYLSLWFRPEHRAKAIACFMAAIPLSNAFGTPFSTALLNLHWFDLAGWRWIFIIEGIAPVLAGIGVLFCLPDRPASATWLADDERDQLQAELDREHAKKSHGSHFEWVNHLGTVLLLTVVYFCLNLTSYGLSMFMPDIIKSQSGLSDTAAGYLTTLPYLFAFIAILTNGWHSDRTGERIWHVAVPLTCWGLSIGLAALVSNVAVLPALVMIGLVGTFMYAHLPAFWPIPSIFLGSSAAASAIGFINMIGNLGGSVGPIIIGRAADSGTLDKHAQFASGLMKVAPWPIMAAAVILIVGLTRRKSLRDARDDRA